jgi:hypothetical protein
VFCDALEREGLLPLIEARHDGLVDPSRDDPSRPILLAMSDIHPESCADRACEVRPAV